MLASAPAWAAVPIASCPYFISAPGNYVVTADLTCPFISNMGNAGIVITASNVSVNLNGRTITGFVGREGIKIMGDREHRVDHVGISGPGLIRNFGTGIVIQDADFVQVSGVTVAGTGAGTALSDDQSVFGIFASRSSRLTVGQNVISQAFYGVLLDDSVGAAVTGNQVLGNVFGIVVGSGSGNAVTGNTASGNKSIGILLGNGHMLVTTSRVASNTTNGNGDAGIAAGTGAFSNQIFSNTSVGNTGNDLRETHICGSNLWSSDTFFTRYGLCEQ